MPNRPKRLLHLLLFALLPLCGAAQEADSLRASLLTCAPGRQNYALYGHTALRIARADGGADWTFNYGVFSFEQRGFLWHFMMGRTDYTVSAVPTPAFVDFYTAEGRAVTELPLNLTQAETLRLLALVNENVGTPGWTYRYNFLKDNCATRVIDLIRDCLDGELQIPHAEGDDTYRSIIHRYADAPDPWGSFGQDLLLGTAVDTLLSDEARLAFPELAQRLVQGAGVVEPGGSVRSLAGEAEVINAAALQRQNAAGEAVHRPWITPMLAALVVLMVALWVSVRQWRGHPRASRIFDDAAMLVTGLAGCLVCLLFFFSELPAVGSNRLVVMLNPLPLLWLPWKVRNDRRGKRDSYVPFVQPVLLMAGNLACLGQSVPAAFWVLALSLLVRSVACNLTVLPHCRLALVLKVLLVATVIFVWVWALSGLSHGIESLSQ